MQNALNDTRLSLIKKLGEAIPDQPGQMHITKPDSLAEFNAQMQSAMEADVKDVEIETVSKKDIMGKDGSNQISIGVLTELITLNFIK